ncbi:hypothetical protein SYNTR_1702 [Candidatus Syntrophocurvum alkaliphilum]|uniref:N-acetyltransferase domain-containing protein n=1 Tax=Candidatus Syntrophocurvum alkaliphilum TaxID=2293317 RepID=A0A6I6DJU9_9FIRM|nr:GNAT family N-acetyltransferase [Candidatus Syntrophocurvum alkaliphilum]QGU00296.1 hypothetical protein SYNTR_1702 [Candidatus Syntrophocurvum alkaliphilum]
MIQIEQFSLNKHDRSSIAKLIFDSDIEMNSLVYGKKEEGIRIITELLAMENNYYNPQYVKLAIIEDEVIGVIVGYPLEQKQDLDKGTGLSYSKVMGTWAFLKKIPLYNKMGRITGGEMDQKGYYIVAVCVDSNYQGTGIGRKLIEALHENIIYLHININNQKAYDFYKRLGFNSKNKQFITHKGKKYGTFLMERK